MLTPFLKILIESRPLPPADMQTAFRFIMEGKAPEVEVAAFLTALRMKGETPGEIAAAVQVLREHMIPLDAGGLPVLDTCGPGGVHRGTFNISTATAFVVAGCGVPVVKHGNRSVSSVSGSADVFAELGVNIDCDVKVVARCLREANLAFCFAPRFHPAMKQVAAVRKQLGFRTIFNLMGPLLNPANARRQLIGVGTLELLEKLADCVALLGGEHVILVHGGDGLDEVTLGAPTAVRIVRAGVVEKVEWTPADFGLPPTPLDAIQVRSVQESAEMVRSVLHGKQGPALNIVLANAAAALLAAGRTSTLIEGVAAAKQAIAEGRAANVLHKLASISSDATDH